ncbi:FAD/NAD(P)-binding domain-containing protein [Pleurotus eryngii]|uniref:FAD/NAD(P)-binding domain-containing protein n=1 Tax=Pleurotus eryngii TaxID=5323 RepID=A0A9P6D2B7_PLEER|nr:FAD/NAD(P)-binding domain-containing protein [Pleurotus eryngii]
MTSKEPHVVVIGAGLAGISTGIALKQQLNCKNFTIYEKANNVVGTWRENTYPSTYFVGQPELQAYWEGLFHKHGLVVHTQFNTLYKSAVWDVDAQLYRIVLEDSITGAKIETQAHAIVFAMGGFARAMYPPEILGREVFKGAIWHSAEWDHRFVLQGKRVGVISNGCSVYVEHQYLRLTRDVNSKYPGWVQTLFAYVPGVMRLYRNIIMAVSDTVSLAFRKENTFVLKQARKGFTKYLKSKLPKEMLEKMTPSYRQYLQPLVLTETIDYPPHPHGILMGTAPGCRRIIVDVGYLDALQQPNVTVNWDGIDSIVEGGIKTKTGEVIELDAITCGSYAINTLPK